MLAKVSTDFVQQKYNHLEFNLSKNACARNNFSPVNVARTINTIGQAWRNSIVFFNCLITVHCFHLKILTDQLD